MSTLGFIISLLVIGAIAGFVARALVPGRQSLSLPATIGLGVVGSFVGGTLMSLLRGGGFRLEPGRILVSILGAIIALVIYIALTGRSSSSRRI